MLGKYSVFFLCLLTGCVGPITALYPPTDAKKNFKLFVVNHGWHTGLVLRRADVPPGRWPQLIDFPKAKYIEIGWGDAGFYQAKQITSGLALKAIFWPTSSVLHVVGLEDSAEVSFPYSQVLTLPVSEAGWLSLIQFIEHSYAYDEYQHWQLIGHGIYGDSRFYQAQGYYHLFHTCNHWTAAAIRATGYPISRFYAFSAGNVLYQLQQAQE